MAGRDFAWSYPFFGGDGVDWLSNGLAMAGEPVAWSGRQPGLPLILAALDRVGLPWLFPWFSIACGAAVAALAYDIARRALPGDPASSRVAAFACGGVVLANEALTGMSLEVMADVAAIALCAATMACAARRRLRAAVACGALAGCFQLAAGGFALAIVVGAELAARGRRLPRRPEIVRLALSVLCVVPGWLASQAILASAAVTPTVPLAQGALVRPSLLRVDDFALAVFAFVGLPACAIALFALGRAAFAVRQGARQEPATPGSVVGFAAICWLVSVVAFFGVLYDWQAPRFAAYAAVPIVLLASWEVACWQRPWLRGVGFALCFVGGVGLGSFLAPYRFAVPDRIDFAPARRAAADAHSVVVLVADGASADERRDLRFRLASTLRRRVKVAERSTFGAEWKGWAHVTVASPRAGASLSAYQPDPSGPKWLFWMAAPPPALDSRVGGRPPADDGSGGWVRRWQVRMADVDRHLQGPDGILALSSRSAAGAEAVRRALLSTRTSAAFVLTPDEVDHLEPAVEGDLLDGDPLGARDVVGLELRVARYLGQRVVVLAER